MINEIKSKLENMLNEAECLFNKDGYEVKTELEVSEVEDGYNTYLFPAMCISAQDDEENNALFGFTVEIDKNGKYNREVLEADIADFLNKAKEYAEVINTATDKAEAIKALDEKLREEVANTIKAEAELAAKKDMAAIKATYRQALLIAGAMALVALVYLIITKLF